MTLQTAPYSKDYEITDAMFGAFRSPGGMPFFWKLFGWMTLLYTIAGVFLFPAMLGGYVELLRSVVETQNDPSNPGAVFSGMFRFFAAMMLFMVVFIGITAVIRAAFFRGYFQGEAGGAMPLRLGQDELRQALAILGYYGLYILFTLLVTLVFVVLIALIAGVGAVVSSDEPSVLIIILGVILFIGGYVGLFAAIIWFLVRFSCAGALTALRNETHVMAARHVSANRFWALFGSYLVAGLLAYVASYIAFTVAMLLAFSGLGAGDMVTMLSGLDPEASFEALEAAMQTGGFRVASFVAIVLVSAGYAFYGLFLAGPQAFFTRQWAEAGGLNNGIEYPTSVDEL